jgi:hypothetical protein
MRIAGEVINLANWPSVVVVVVVIITVVVIVVAVTVVVTGLDRNSNPAAFDPVVR